MTSARRQVRHWSDDLCEQRADDLAIEEPLEVRVAWTDRGGRRHDQPVVVTMRTPGDDAALAVGLLASERVLGSPTQVETVEGAGPTAGAGAGLRHAAMRVRLVAGVEPALSGLDRRGFMTSSCGLCGRVSLETLTLAAPLPISAFGVVDPARLGHWPEALRGRQPTFGLTGGVHGAALFSPDGTLLDVAEDVGRHNALDKVLGRAFTGGRWPLHGEALLLSGRVSFDLVLKAAVAGIALVAAVGAPSSMAVDAAEVAGITLVGFVRQRRANVYTWPARVARVRGAAPT